MSTSYGLLLSDKWDLTLDATGRIAVATGAYCVAQNVANAVRLFTNDAWFERDRGIPHYNIELNAHPQLSMLRSRLKATALEIDGVAEATVTLNPVDTETRELTGEIELTLDSGETAEVSI